MASGDNDKLIGLKSVKVWEYSLMWVRQCEHIWWASRQGWHRNKTQDIKHYDLASYQHGYVIWCSVNGKI